MKYPEELTEVESEEYTFKLFDGKKSYKKDYENALKYAKKTKGQVYTMVDGENNKTYYLKGLHYVNRFAFCVLKKELKGGMAKMDKNRIKTEIENFILYFTSDDTERQRMSEVLDERRTYPR